MDVSTDPPGAQVIIDGTIRGVTPLKLDLTPGAHTVTIAANGTSLARSVMIEAGRTATVLAAIAPTRTAAASGASMGWVSLDLPFEAEILEGGKLLGTTGSGRLALAAGWHELEIRNRALEFSTLLNVQVLGGQVARPSVAAPTGSLSINATPWADVSIDGRAVGSTPLANLPVAIGTHEVVFTHPRFGTLRRAVTISGATPVRLSVSFQP
jgi:hypothetical protein